jgi:hypothetical protein
LIAVKRKYKLLEEKKEENRDGEDEEDLLRRRIYRMDRVYRIRR